MSASVLDVRLGSYAYYTKLYPFPLKIEMIARALKLETESSNDVS